MKPEQAISKALIEKTVPIEIDLVYIIYLMEYADLSRN